MSSDERTKKRVFSNDVILNSLRMNDKRRNSVNKSQDAPSDHEVLGIFRSVKIIANKKIELKQKEYYKLPFSTEILNDDTKLFKMIHHEWFVGLIDVYKRYCTDQHHFYVLISGNIVVFGKKITCTPDFQKTVEKQNISFKRVKNKLEIRSEDGPLLFDYILNISINHFEPIPFILSHKKFLNSTFYTSRVSQSQQIKSKNTTKWSYKIDGYVFGPDLVEYNEHDIHYEQI